MLTSNNHNCSSEQISEYVLDTKGFTDKRPCDNCGKSANYRVFDECLGGTINQVYSLDCPHCGHHECDQEFCSICEAQLDSVTDENSKCLESIQKIELILDSLVEALSSNRYVNGNEISQIKLMLTNSKVSDLFNEIVVLRATRNFHYIQRKLLDARFSRNLELKITQAEASFE